MKLTRMIQKAMFTVGIDSFSRTRHDRMVLKSIILPEISRDPRVERVLFVGCDYYTEPYEAIVRPKEYWTIEPLAKLKKYGARRHVVGGVERLREYFPSRHFDAILCNGVVGWGLNTLEAADAAFNSCFEALREGGLLVIGWADDGGARCPFSPEGCASLQRFERSMFAPLGEYRYVTDTSYRHTFLFLRRPLCLAGRGSGRSCSAPERVQTT